MVLNVDLVLIYDFYAFFRRFLSSRARDLPSKKGKGLQEFFEWTTTIILLAIRHSGRSNPSKSKNLLLK